MSALFERIREALAPRISESSVAHGILVLFYVYRARLLEAVTD